VAPGIFKKNKSTNGTTPNGGPVHMERYSNGRTNGNTNGHRNGNLAMHRLIFEAAKLVAIYTAATRQLVLLPLSAHNETSLNMNVSALSQVIGQFPLADVAYTLAARRSRLAQRSFRIVHKENVLQGSGIERNVVRAPLLASKLSFIFTGQGAQWHGMGSDLFEFRAFQTAVDYLDFILGSLPNPLSWTLSDILSGKCDKALIQTAEISQAACTAVQIGLVGLLASWSVRPSSVAGHLSGELAAAYASGRITAA
jgi:acyl transferase domain-containing protein